MTASTSIVNLEVETVLGGSVKLVCTSESPLQSFVQEVARGRNVTSWPISEYALFHAVYNNGG